MPHWTRYPKIAEHGGGAAATGEWLCTEKVHGANFSVVALADGCVEFASRSGVLAATDNFFGYRSQGMDAWLTPRVCALRDALAHDGVVADTDSITVYGELAGGAYPHPDVPAVNGVGPVQRGCWYSPGLVFIAFDVAISSEGSASRFLSFDVARTAAIAAGLRYTVPRLRGSLSQCLDAEVRFISDVPAALGLPPLLENWAEGLVVRPALEPASRTSPGDGRHRGLIKLKIPEFSEKQYANEEWRDARHGAGRVGSVTGSAMGWAEAESLLRFEMLAAINQQRLNSVLSKIGRVNAADKAACRRLLEDFIQDVQEALVEDGLLANTEGFALRHAPLMPELQAESRKLVARHLRAELHRDGQAILGQA
eukprot:CAMPEP_0174695230 /NCGR_PEP_ID=MMETSP1094-20130205/1656_1 /TAXON_ID=156173 /ORGANISM="Chrysochromulina brevifilum, Strain UTEX LB 985" /LENGTH=367 /DNA_ID=CAMNT_0015891679 /DNA_START=52 /DNA_END=1155 /DNA_ORIENTATION=+